MTEYYNVIKVSGEKRLWKRICKEDEEVKTKVRNWINSIKEERFSHAVLVNICQRYWLAEYSSTHSLKESSL